MANDAENEKSIPDSQGHSDGPVTLLRRNILLYTMMMFTAIEILVFFTLITNSRIAKALLCIAAFMLLHRFNMILLTIFGSFQLDEFLQQFLSSHIDERSISKCIEMITIVELAKLIERVKVLTAGIQQHVSNFMVENVWEFYGAREKLVKDGLQAYSSGRFSNICKGLQQFCITISADQLKTFSVVLTSLEMLAFICVFFRPTKILYIGYIFLPTLLIWHEATSSYRKWRALAASK
ncbi:hypothetical protein QUC31_007193 [Theobroma cacao]